VLADIEKEGVDAIWCLGDLVGYGAQPDECVALAKESCDLVLIGNHDLVALGTLDVTDFNDEAAAAALWTRAALDERSRAFLSELEPTATVGDVQMFHASPRDPVWEYVLSAETAYASLLTADAPVVLVGHSHVALAIGLDDAQLHGGLAPVGTEVKLDGRWLLNPGSVGQPRDGDPDAAWLALDTDARFARFHRVAYPIERTQAAIREHGLPEALAVRLADGI